VKPGKSQVVGARREGGEALRELRDKLLKEEI